MPKLKSSFLARNNSVTFIGYIDDKSINKAISTIKKFHDADNKKCIIMRLHSAGGDPDKGFAFYEFIKHDIRPNIVIHAAGTISSSGILLFLSANSDKRFVSKNARFRFHEFSLEFEKSSKYYATELYQDALELLREQKRYSRLVSRESSRKLQAKEVYDFMFKDTTLNAKQMISYNLATGYID